ncbi:hypothetical protein CPB84DRAFT_1845804 [Gymnopilus junonius]|uniref:Uncharacterized protein n=1 Tax=Gymnopilus junonius TaxID=109634 RepID=A0A9P5NTS1_GYMJU|nr:hypothetical protein CPB84DRAFT_1845804 [Gymnopilus junonius]
MNFATNIIPPNYKHDIRGVCLCLLCGSALSVQLAKGGRFPGHYYLHCNFDYYHFIFPDNVAQNPAVGPQSSNAAAPASAVGGSLSGLPTFPLPPVQELQDHCAAAHCSKARHRECKQNAGWMCKKCCIKRSGCSAPGHQYHRLTTKQQERLKDHHPSPTPAAPAPHLTLPFGPVLSDAEFLTSLIEELPSIRLVAEGNKRAREEAAEASQLALQVEEEEHEEEHNFQAALAASLGQPYIVPHPSSGLSSTIPASVSSSQQPPGAVRPNTQHMNKDWMRPYEDHMAAKRRTRVHNNADHHFCIIFWGENDKPPAICAIHECPEWPKWALIDASLDVRDQLSLTAENLQFYDVAHRQWVACSPSYPHDVKKDGYLFLQRPYVVSLIDFDDHLALAEERPIHFHHNIMGERAYIQEEHRERRRMAVPVVDVSDNEVEIIEHLTSHSPLPWMKLQEETHNSATSFQTPFQTPAKCPSQEKESYKDDNIDSRPSQRRCCTPFSSSPLLSPLPSFLSTIPAIQHTEIVVLESSKPWPHGMFTVDMMNAFRAVDTVMSKDRKLNDCLREVFGKDVPTRTFQDQRKHWKLAAEQHRQAFVAAGRSEAGLWSAFHDHSK